MLRVAPLALGIAAALIGGCDDSIDVRLVAPPGETTTTVDYSCVSHVEVVAYGNGDDIRQTCLELDEGAVRSLRDHDLAGRLALDIPADFVQLDVRGVLGAGDACLGYTIFHGEATYNGGWDLAIPLQRGLDCADFSAIPTPVQLLDLDKLLLANPATRCQPPAGVADFRVRLDHQFPYLFGTALIYNGVETISDVLAPDANGLVTVAEPHFRRALAPSCLAAGTTVAPATAAQVSSCLDLAQGTLCADPGAGELLTMSTATAAALRQIATYTDTAVSAGLVWDAVTRQPIAGATVERLDGFDDLQVGYLESIGGALSPRSADETATNGLFVVEIVAPTLVLVSAPNYRARTIVMSASSISAPGANSIALRR